MSVRLSTATIALRTRPRPLLGPALGRSRLPLGTILVSAVLHLLALGALRQAFATRTDKTLYLKADAGLSYGVVVETMDRVRRAGIERLGMVTEPARER